MRDHDGKLIGFAKVTRDITERRPDQSRLSKRAPVPPPRPVRGRLCDLPARQGRRSRHLERGAEQIKGYSADEIIGRHFSVFYTEEDRAAGIPAQTLATASERGKI